MEVEKVDELIEELEALDSRIVNLNVKRGMVNTERAQVLKYQRCFLFDKLTRVMNGEPEEEKDNEWGEMK